MVEEGAQTPEPLDPSQVAARRSVRLGAWMLGALLLVALGLEMAEIALTVLDRGSGPKAIEIAKVVGRPIFYVFVMLGYSWARWLCVIGFLLRAALTGLTLGLLMGADPPNVVLIVVVGIYGLFHVACALAMFVPNPITAYFVSRNE